MVAAAEPGAGERIAKRIARAGLCSRREAERWIRAGRVAVDGETVARAAFNVAPGQPITDAAEPPRLWRYHKPRGLLTTTRDPEARATVFERLPPDLPRVVAVGRLDLNSEGLLLLTNDGELARRLELPRCRWRRRYRVRAHGKLSPPALAELAGGATVDGIRYAPIAVRVDREGRNSWLTVDLHEGRNREIRKVFESIGLAVNRLIRVSYGPFRLASLAPGEVREVPRKTLPARLSEHADHRR
ncbi:MAG: rRNA pseudouridine synthase [Alphaproteobacteria bacterium]|nr:rRNA pseudouridine synthase [Alphaproteobacteria bacterium]